MRERKPRELEGGTQAEGDQRSWNTKRNNYFTYQWSSRC